jgi:aspartokinase
VNVVMKFGGTSVADADAMTRVIGIVRRQLDASLDDHPPVVVVSAMSKVTDRLIETGRLTGIGDADAAAQMLADLLERHIAVARSLVDG